MQHINPARVAARGVLAVRADGANLATLIQSLNSDFKEFKDTMQAKDKEIEKRFDDVVTTEKLARIDASVSDLQAAVDAANAKLAAAEMGGLGGADTPVDAEYTQAFRAHFRAGEIQAALNKGNDEEGGYLAPVEWDRTITNKLVEVSPMRQISTIQRISGSGFKKLFNLRGTGSGWVGEETARTETNSPEFGSMTIETGEIYANPAATANMLDDAEINLENWLAGEVDTEFAFQEGGAFVAGNGTNKPYGFLTFAEGAANAAKNPLGSIEVVELAGQEAVTSDELLDLIYALPSSYTLNARWIMNRTSQGKVRKLKDGDGNYLWQPSAVAGQPATLHAYPVTEMQDMPDLAAGAMPIAFGDFRRGYLVIDRAGVRVLRDPFTNKPYVMFYTTKRVGGAVIDPQAIKIAKNAAAE